MKDKDWSPEWLTWLESIASISPHVLRESLIVALADALARRTHEVIAFLTRRLAAELAEHEWSRGQALKLVKQRFETSDDFDALPVKAFSTVLMELFGEREEIAFVARIQVTPVRVPASVARFDRAVTATMNNVLELRELRIPVRGFRADDAAARAIENARQLLEHLRLYYYVNTHLRSDEVLLESDRNEQFAIPLAKPFWPKRNGLRRQVPRVPPTRDRALKVMSDAERSSWKAAEWHLSQALAAWGEDGFVAASQVWQALETFSGAGRNAKARVTGLAEEFIRSTILDAARYFSLGVGRQRQEMERVGRACDWQASRKGGAAEQWVSRVLSESSQASYRQWKQPPAPDLLFHPEVGILRSVGRRLHAASSELWMERRIRSDLALLYAVRNDVVHRGERFLGGAIARYLSEVGLEVLLSAMQARARSLVPDRAS